MHDHVFGARLCVCLSATYPLKNYELEWKRHGRRCDDNAEPQSTTKTPINLSGSLRSVLGGCFIRSKNMNVDKFFNPWRVAVIPVTLQNDCTLIEVIFIQGYVRYAPGLWCIFEIEDRWRDIYMDKTSVLSINWVYLFFFCKFSQGYVLTRQGTQRNKMKYYANNVTLSNIIIA